jgi:uncharacterized membrane protein YkvA (DUF1232 family)
MDQVKDDDFWRKVGRVARVAGRQVLSPAMLLFYVLKRPDTPAWAKAIVVGALVYFISPFDAIPDVIPVVGYTDDLGVMAGALATVAAFIDEAVKAAADRKLQEWLGW